MLPVVTIIKEKKMLRAQAITHKYNDFTALDDVSISVNSGEIVGLLGKNGAGKSTLMRVLTGFMRPTKGQIFFEGLNLWESKKNIQSKIGYLPENNVIYQDMSVLDYLMFVSEIRGLPKEERFEWLYQAVLKTGLESKLHSCIFELSRGFRQRVGVAQAIINKPKILILDEPTNGLDPTQVLQIRGLIKELKTANTAILVSTHILNEAEAICDRVVVLKSGQKTVDLAVEDFTTTGKINLTVDKFPQELSATLNQKGTIENIDIVEHSHEKTQLLLTLRKGFDLNNETAAIIEHSVRCGVKVYQANQDYRGLEFIFNEDAHSGDLLVE